MSQLRHPSPLKIHSKVSVMSDSSSLTRILFFDFGLSATTNLTPSQTSRWPPVMLD